MDRILPGAGERSFDSVPAAGSGLLFVRMMRNKFCRYKGSHCTVKGISRRLGRLHINPSFFASAIEDEGNTKILFLTQKFNIF